MNVAVVAALADWLAAMTTPAPITVPTSSRRAARPRPLSLHPFISVLLSRAGPRWVGRGRPGLFSRAGNGCTVCNRGARGSTAVLNTLGKTRAVRRPSSSFVNEPIDAASRCSAAAGARLSAEVDASVLTGRAGLGPGRSLTKRLTNSTTLNERDDTQWTAEPTDDLLRAIGWTRPHELDGGQAAHNPKVVGSILPPPPIERAGQARFPNRA